MTTFELDTETGRSLLFSFLTPCMDEELYYHRIFVRPRREIALPRVADPKVRYGPLAIFVQEAIDYSLLKRFGIDEWHVPFDMVQLRNEFPDKMYFNTMIGRAICHECCVKDSLEFAKKGDFNITHWLTQKQFAAMEYAANFLEILRKRTRPVNISIMNMLSFASYLVFEATTSENPDLVEAVCRSTVYMLYRSFPYEWIYWNSRLWALTYNAVHNDLHETWESGGFHHNLA